MYVSTGRAGGLWLLAPQRGLFATVRSKSKNKSKSPDHLATCKGINKNRLKNRLPYMSNGYCHPARGGGYPHALGRLPTIAIKQTILSTLCSVARH
jgi:hypothetical protein